MSAYAETSDAWMSKDSLDRLWVQLKQPMDGVGRMTGMKLHFRGRAGYFAIRTTQPRTWRARWRRTRTEASSR